MVSDVPAGPFPINCGLVVETVSPSVKLSKITVVGAGVCRFEGTLNFDSDEELAGRLSSAFGLAPPAFAGKLLKSETFPRIRGGMGFADWG